MSKCSKKCNEIVEKINSISGLDDDIIYDWLIRLENVTDSIVDIIDNYADINELNGTCFKEDKKDMNKTDKLLIKHNIVPGYLGYNYIKTILESNLLNADYKKITDIYQSIAKVYNTTSGSVERTIRTILSKSDIYRKSNKQSLYLLQLEYEGE